MLRHKPYGNRIKIFRDARCWTQRQLARAAGYSVKTIWKAEAGCALKRQTLNDIAQALGVHIEDIAQLPTTPKLRRRLSSHESANKRA